MGGRAGWTAVWGEGAMTQFVMCIRNGRYKRRLKLHVVYKAIRSGFGWRLVDESGVEREYNERYFVPITLTAEGAAAFD